MISRIRVSRAVCASALTALLLTHEPLLAQPPLPPVPLTPIPSDGGPITPPAFHSPPANPPAPAQPSERERRDQVQPGETVIQVRLPFSKLQLRVLDSRVLELGNRIKIVDGFDADRISVKALSPHRIRLHAEKAGVTTVKLIDEFDNIHTLEVFVEPDTRELQAYLELLFPATSIQVVGIRDGVVLRGWVTEPSQIPEIMAVAEQFYEIVNPQLTVAGPNLVQLQVKVIEVQRSKLRELGFNFLLAGQHYYVANTIGGLAPLSGVDFTQAATKLTSAGAAFTNSELQLGIAGKNGIFQGFLHAMINESLAKILAEPTLITTSGRPATVHSGGKFPILVPQGMGTVTIDWKDYGVKLEAVPIVLGEGRLRLDLYPEVSERDYSTSVTVNGMVVPGIISRSVNTQVEMRFGETLMIGGLISSRNQGTTSKVPFLGELPWIGAAFSRKSYQMGETELVILVTPQMVSPMSPHQVPAGGPGLFTASPTYRELYGEGLLEVPNYGPECPDGNCGNQVPVAPPGIQPMPAASVNAVLPTAAVSSRSQIQQTNGESIQKPGKQAATAAGQTVGSPQAQKIAREQNSASSATPYVDPFASVNEQRGASAESNKPVGTPTKLPGLIEPRSGSATANQPARAN